MSASEIVNKLETAWKIIEDNKPSSKLATARANAVPKVDDWTAISGAKGPRESRWYIKMTNSLPESWGDIVVDCELYLRYTYGATYKGGGFTSRTFGSTFPTPTSPGSTTLSSS